MGDNFDKVLLDGDLRIVDAGVGEDAGTMENWAINRPFHIIKVDTYSVSDSQSAYLEGGTAGTDTDSSTSAYAAGGLNVTDNQEAYAHGQDSASDSQAAYLIGSQNVTDSSPVYLKGQDTDLDNQPAYTHGQLSDSDSTPAYLEGAAGATDSTAAYLKGQDTDSDSSLAYLAGSLDVTDSQAAYLDAQASDSDSISAYLAGGLTDSDSMPAYLEGCGEYLIPDGDIAQSGSWKKEDAGTTNLYVSIDEQPGPNDADYVWHETVSGAEYFEVSLSDPSGGTVGAGDVKIFWRGKKISGPLTVTMRVQLREGAAVIASSDEVFTGSEITYSYTLSAPEIASITDWTNLRLRFIVQGAV